MLRDTHLLLQPEVLYQSHGLSEDPNGSQPTGIEHIGKCDYFQLPIDYRSRGGLWHRSCFGTALGAE